MNTVITQKFVKKNGPRKGQVWMCLQASTGKFEFSTNKYVFISFSFVNPKDRHNRNICNQIMEGRIRTAIGNPYRRFPIDSDQSLVDGVRLLLPKGHRQVEQFIQRCTRYFKDSAGFFLVAPWDITAKNAERVGKNHSDIVKAFEQKTGLGIYSALNVNAPK